MLIKNINDIKNIFYINLEHRTDRKEHVELELTNIGLTNYQRFNAIKMPNGAIGCSMSHLKLLETALEKNMEHILIVEDDITFLNPSLFIEQFNKCITKLDNNWDVILFAGNNIPPYNIIDDSCVQVTRCQTTTGYLVNGHYIKILIKNIKMGLIQLLNKPDQHSIFAIDKFWFVLQQNSRWFLITPLSVIQREDYSDIEKKETTYKNAMLDLDKEEMFKAIKQYKINNQIKQQIQDKKQSPNQSNTSFKLW
jgi:glycosyl transferase family 25